MTENQINVILTTAKLGSISAAAKELHLSQPNASSCIKAVEEEFGIQIFRRTREGIEITVGGAALLEQAQKISEATGAIRHIKESISARQFRLGSDSYSASFNAFTNFCSCCSSEENINFQIFKVSLERGIELMREKKIDCLTALNFEEDDLTVNRLCAENHIQQVFLRKVPTAVCVRKGHPLLSQASAMNFFHEGQVLKPYAYVYYGHLNHENEIMHTYKTLNIPHTGMILIPDTNLRLRIVSSTNAFSIGVRHSKEVLEEYGLAEIPITDIRFSACCYFSEQSSGQEETRQFIRLYKKELAGLE